MEEEEERRSLECSLRTPPPHMRRVGRGEGKVKVRYGEVRGVFVGKSIMREKMLMMKEDEEK